MICGNCTNSFDPEQQSVACPHLKLSPPTPRRGGPRLRVEVQREMDDQFNLRDRSGLTRWQESANFAARFYANVLLERLDKIEADEAARAAMRLEE